MYEAIIDAEFQTETHFQDEQDPEEEHEAAQRLFAPALEALVVDAIDGGAQQVEQRREQDPGEDRVEAERLVHHVRRVRAEDEERGLGDVGDVEEAEDEPDTQAHCGIEAPEQQSGDHRVRQQVPGEQGTRAISAQPSTDR